MLDAHLKVTTRPLAKKENIILWDTVRVTVLTDRLFRVERDETRTFCDGATQAVWYRDLPAVKWKAEEKDGMLSVRTNAVTLVVGREEKDDYVLIGRKRVPCDNSGNLGGTYRTLDCCDGGDFCVHPGKDIPQPITLGNGIVSRTGVAVLDDSVSLILAEDGMLKARDPERDTYVFAYGKDYRGALRAFFALTGTPPMIPRYALGNWWSRYHAYSDREYLRLMDRFAERHIPLTVATIDMDWHWSKTLDGAKGITASGKNDAYHGGNSGWTGYSWNTDLFPDYKKFLSDLHARNLHVTLNLHPADGVRYFEDMYPEFARAVGKDPATEEAIPFDITDDKFINAYFKILHKPYERDGVDFWWMDWQQGTKSNLPGCDPLWSLNHYHTLDNAVLHAPLLLSRYAGPGSHRYPLGFSGDTYMTWKTLAYLPYFTSTASNIGYTWWSHDIGGHYHGAKDDELYVRFLQFGVFSPVNRLHSTQRADVTKEPWVYMNGKGLVAEEFLRLRHKLIPYLYSASYRTTEDGRALVEPLYYECPDAPEAYRSPNGYLFGESLLVAAITQPGDKKGLSSVRTYLPAGRWTDIFTGDTYRGGKTVEMVRWCDTIPVLLREGGIFPLDNRETQNGTENPDKMRVLVANGNGQYTLTEDGEGGRADTRFVTTREDGIQKLSFICEDAAGVTPKRTYRFEFCNLREGTVTVKANGKVVSCIYDTEPCLTVTVENTRAGVRYEVIAEAAEQDEKARWDEAEHYNMARFELTLKEKDALGKALLAAETAEEYRAAVEDGAGVRLTKNEKKRLLEVLQ